MGTQPYAEDQSWGARFKRLANPVHGLKTFFDFLEGGQRLPDSKEDKAMIDGHLSQGSPYINPTSPYAGNWRANVNQLQARADGSGPSVAGNAYRSASQNALSQQLAMSRGGRSAGAGRQAAQGLGQVNQGMAAGYASARDQEMVNAQQALQGALAGADNSGLQREKANQDAWLTMLAAKLGVSKAQLQGLMGKKSGSEVVGGLLSGIGVGGAAVGG